MIENSSMQVETRLLLPDIKQKTMKESNGQENEEDKYMMSLNLVISVDVLYQNQ